MDNSGSTGGYENIALSYASVVDTKAMHLYYERPHTWSLIPENLTGLKVVDLGCGSGWYSEQLAKNGAKVTAIDASAKMIELTKKRLHNQGDFHLADLEKPLHFLEDNHYDLVVAPLVIHYVKDWQPFFSEISRILKTKGLFVFSTHQPQIEAEVFQLENYFTKKLLIDHWPGIGEVKFYHHTIHELGEALYHNQFVMERLLEPQPLPGFEKADPKMYEKVSKKPWFLFVRARKWLI